MNQTHHIGFTGSRFGLSEQQKKEIIAILDQCRTMVVNHGDCIGSDADFHDLCLKYRKDTGKDLTIQIHPPDNKSFRAFKLGDVIMKEEPYLKRNDNIIKQSNFLIACPIDKN